MAAPHRREVSCRRPAIAVILLILSALRVRAFNIFQPSGLSNQLVTSLAQNRYDPQRHYGASPMEGRVAIVTGAAGGIGKELCTVLHSLGCIVVALDRNETGLKVLHHSLGSRVTCLPTSHEDLASVASTAELIKERYNKIDLLINNAGLTYNGECTPGEDKMKSTEGKDLAFTVNYLSHFLLVEKIMPCLQQSDKGRIVHMTSSYHWKVDGSELVPTTIGSNGKEPLAYQSDPLVMSNKHTARSYANTKLAQIWHSRSIKGCESVCACPTWVATGIAGDSGRSFLERFAFPVDGAGISSAINAIFRSPEELGDALNNGKSFVANSRTLEYIPFKESWSSDLMRDWRDDIVDFGGLILLLGQRFTYEKFIVQDTSPESCRQEEMKSFYDWSLKEVQPWL